jgi:hypothetical protein
MNLNAIITLVLVAVGVVLILAGALMALKDWRKAHEAEIKGKEHALGEALTGLAKVLEALKGYPQGQQLIGFGIVVLIIAGLFGGITAL